MDWRLPTTKYSPQISKSPEVKVRDPRAAAIVIKARTKDIHPVFHHVKSSARLAIGLAFIVGSGYIMSYPEQAYRAVDKTLAYLDHADATYTAAALKIFDLPN
jgi:hypothetical protein